MKVFTSAGIWRQRLCHLTAAGRGRRAAGASFRARLWRRGRITRSPPRWRAPTPAADRIPEPAGGEPPPGVAGRRGRNGATAERSPHWAPEPGAGRGRCAALGTEAGCRGGRHAPGTMRTHPRHQKPGLTRGGGPRWGRAAPRAGPGRPRRRARQPRRRRTRPRRRPARPGSASRRTRPMRVATPTPRSGAEDAARRCSARSTRPGTAAGCAAPWRRPRCGCRSRASARSTDTSRMFMMPMPPTRSEIDAIAASRLVITRLAIERRLEHLASCCAR